MKMAKPPKYYDKSNEKYFANLDRNLTNYEDIDQACTLRDLQEQGTRAVQKLVNDPDPAWDPDIDHRVGKGGRNSKNYSTKTTIPEDYRKKWYED
tara:strand:- start:3361 stop:3645 length:285 start_codon:yes stop_codon:yes gene_type:complete